MRPFAGSNQADMCDKNVLLQDILSPKKLPEIRNHLKFSVASALS